LEPHVGGLDKSYRFTMAGVVALLMPIGTALIQAPGWLVALAQPLSNARGGPRPSAQARLTQTLQAGAIWSLMVASTSRSS